jgi:peptide-methionine (S)-S-oxide reductase
MMPSIARGGLLPMLRLSRVSFAALVFLAAAFTVSAQAQAPAKGGGKAAIATFAGGCFWCVEEAFDKVPGVIETISGFIGGTAANPSYEQVMTKKTGHAEAVQVTYDPSKVSYQQLVDWFWRNIDPVDASGQFCDKGSPYRSGIFYHDEAQKKVAEETKQALKASGRFKQPIVTEITSAGPFYPAEDYHQDYYKKNSSRYQFYKYGCGRVQRLEQIWGKATPPPNT